MTNIELVSIAKRIDILESEQKEANAILFGCGGLMWRPEFGGVNMFLGREIPKILRVAPNINITARMSGISLAVKCYGLKVFDVPIAGSSTLSSVDAYSELVLEATKHVTAFSFEKDIISKIKPFIGGAITTFKTSELAEFDVNYYFLAGITFLSNYFPSLEFNFGVRSTFSNTNECSQGNPIQGYAEVKYRI